jgi:hypothetical protein
MAISPAEINGCGGNAMVHKKPGPGRVPEAKRVCEFVTQHGDLIRR